ncbi:homoserine O-acetyltransferase [Demequina sp. SYSU T00068]|uniref:homoserine O-acetyltransferase MetX n=1 Tax=Demequina lignilytica TaxID=3051663 RepID=UPI00260A9C89|nr:homoserine O-acetyltransferase [Demequina sp. SYSU T00068]MDN4490638.1 homoserine O-acetyltransferase [Demequina sp. SYSU T00068]
MTDHVDTAWAPAGEARDGHRPIPASSAWRPGDHPGQRKFAHVGVIPLEGDPRGELDVTLAYETWGELNEARDNAVYVAHAFTGDSHVVGEAGPGHLTGGWWEDLVGPGKVIDTDRYFVVSANVVGGCQGSTGPAHPHPEDGRPWGSSFPYVTLHDQVVAEARLADLLGVDAWALVIGPSMGGMRAVEWAATFPERVRAIGAIGTTAATTADQISWHAAQAAAIRLDPGFHGGDYYDQPDGEGPHHGLGLARVIAHTTYRSAPELNERFGRAVQDGDPLRPEGFFAVESYLDHHADKLARRFDANAYLRMLHAINTHDVGRGRGGVEAALSRYEGEALVVAIDSDRLYPLSDAERLAGALPSAELVVLHSEIGHDGFLVPESGLNDAVAGLLERVAVGVGV